MKTGAAKVADLCKVAATFRSQVQCGHRRYTKPPRAEEKRRDFGPAYLCRDHATVLRLSVFSIERREAQGETDFNRLWQVFANVQWGAWLLIMVAYSLFYFGIDTLVVSRALNWLAIDIRYRDILPVRASAYIVSLFNEQVGKGGMAWYLHRRHQVPGWEVGSVMLFIMFCEVFYLLVWASIGFVFAADDLPAAFGLVPWLGAGGAIVLAVWIAFFRGKLLPNNTLRDKPGFFTPLRLRDHGIIVPFSCLDRRVIGGSFRLCHCAELVWCASKCPRFITVVAGDLLCCGGANSDASGSNYVLGWCCFQTTKGRWQPSASCNITSLFYLMPPLDCCSGGVHSATYSVLELGQLDLDSGWLPAVQEGRKTYEQNNEI